MTYIVGGGEGVMYLFQDLALRTKIDMCRNYWKNAALQLWLKQYHNWFLHNNFSKKKKKKFLGLTVAKQKSNIRTLRKKLGKHVKQNYNPAFSHLLRKSNSALVKNSASKFIVQQSFSFSVFGTLSGELGKRALNP